VFDSLMPAIQMAAAAAMKIPTSAARDSLSRARQPSVEANEARRAGDGFDARHRAIASMRW
jgi:hypothetical protein